MGSKCMSCTDTSTQVSKKNDTDLATWAKKNPGNANHFNDYAPGMEPWVDFREMVKSKRSYDNRWSLMKTVGLQEEKHYVKDIYNWGVVPHDIKDYTQSQEIH